MIVDGYDLGLIGYAANNDFRDAFGAPQRDWISEYTHGRLKETLLTPDPVYKKRIMIVNGAIVADDRATLDGYIDELKYRLYDGELGIRFSNDETREYMAYCDQITVTPYQPALIQRAAKVALRFAVVDPRMRAIADSVVGFTTATAMPMGTAKTLGVLRLTGGTNPIVIYKNYAGTEVARMEFTWAGTWIDVDLDNQTIIDDLSANQAATLTGGNFFYLDPRDGDYLLTQWPTLEVSGGGSGQTTYRKMYW
jgi:hypothetical protein